MLNPHLLTMLIIIQALGARPVTMNTALPGKTLRNMYQLSVLHPIFIQPMLIVTHLRRAAFLLMHARLSTGITNVSTGRTPAAAS
jgi:hypothetical protein